MPQPQNHSPSLAVVILAAGMGTRMNSKYQKILHEVGGRPMIEHVYQTATAVATFPPVLVIGQGGERVQELLGAKAHYVVQQEKLGTGHATLVTAELLAGQTQQVAVMNGDNPLLKAETLAKLADHQAQTGAAVVILSVLLDETSTFGRVVRDDSGRVIEILEVSEAKGRPDSYKWLSIREQNAGMYLFDAAWLWANINQMPKRTARNGNTEYYLTDMIEIAVKQGQLVDAIITDDTDEALGAGTRAELVDVEKAFRRRANQRWLEAGVTLIDPDTIYIDQMVTIGQDTVIWPNSYIQGHTTIGADCAIGPNTILRNAIIADNCRIEQAVVEDTAVEAGEVVLPFTHRKG